MAFLGSGKDKERILWCTLPDPSLAAWTARYRTLIFQTVERGLRREREKLRLTRGNFMRGAIAIVLTLMTLLGTHRLSGASELPSEDVRVLITADELTFDRVEEVVTARGNVEISQNERVLVAD